MHARNTSLPESEWLQLRAAFLSGAGLRALAREAGLPAGTVLARAHRERWSTAKRQGIATAQASQRRPKVDAAQAIAHEAEDRAQRHIERMKTVCETIGTHVETLPPGLLFEGISRLDALDRLARRSHGLDSGSGVAVQLLFASASDLGISQIHEADKGELLEAGEWEEE